MSASVVAALACAVFAAVGTGVLVGRSIRVPRLDLVAWACALLALAVALGAQAYGMYRGYGSGTFRAVQFGAQLIAPLWLAWGLTELTAKSGITRFGAKLITMALTVVTGVVLVTDPLSDTPFSTTWPPASKIAFLVLGPMLDMKLYLMYTRVFRTRLIFTIIISVVSQVFVYCMILHYLTQLWS